MKALFSYRRPDPSRASGPYQESLITVTKAGTIFTTAFFLIFALIYWFGDYPLFAVLINLASVFCSLAGFFLISKYGLHLITADLITFTIYLSSAGVMAISGGIHSSSIVWQIFVPVASFIMAGLYAGLRWGSISFLTVLIFFLLDQTLFLRDITRFEATNLDYFLDISGTILAVTIAIWYSDHLKSRSLTQLEEARIQLNFFATVDPLTNIFNRRYFLELAERKINRIRATQGLAVLVMFDIDHFKKINDEHGHIIGDQILQGVAQLCLKNLRVDDILGRFGCEEFVILLPNTKLEDARSIADRLRLLVAENPIMTEVGLIQARISIGITAIDLKVHDAGLDQLLARADKAMYRAKQNGRNRVIVWEDHSLPTT